MAYFEFMQTAIITLALSRTCLIGHKHFITLNLNPVIAEVAMFQKCFVYFINRYLQSADPEMHVIHLNTFSFTLGHLESEKSS